MKKEPLIITSDQLGCYARYLWEQERAVSTVRKYLHDINVFYTYLDGRPLDKAALITWKEGLSGRYAPATVNSMLTAVNGFLAFVDRRELAVKLVKIQKALFCEADRELTRSDYIRLVNAACREGNEKLALILQTICSTGIRISELNHITVEAVAKGKAEILNKGKRRIVFLPKKLRQLLVKYLSKQKKTSGTVFTTRTGRPLDRSNIWRDMKRLCKSAGVEPEKVFPHNLRHLFARTYYSAEKDIFRLADILGHSSVNTTRIYTVESGQVHIRQLERLNFIIT